MLCREVGGSLSLHHRVDEEWEELVDARFFPREAVAGLDVRPNVFRDGFWQDREAGFPTFRYLGLHHAADV